MRKESCRQTCSWTGHCRQEEPLRQAHCGSWRRSWKCRRACVAVCAGMAEASSACRLRLPHIPAHCSCPKTSPAQLGLNLCTCHGRQLGKDRRPTPYSMRLCEVYKLTSEDFPGLCLNTSRFKTFPSEATVRQNDFHRIAAHASSPFGSYPLRSFATAEARRRTSCCVQMVGELYSAQPTRGKSRCCPNISAGLCALASVQADRLFGERAVAHLLRAVTPPFRELLHTSAGSTPPGAGTVWADGSSSEGSQQLSAADRSSPHAREQSGLTPGDAPGCQPTVKVRQF